jgi:tetratricopeptide (TPR) repeat protein
LRINGTNDAQLPAPLISHFSDSDVAMTDQKKGFGGFGDLVSDISVEVPSTPQRAESISKVANAPSQASKPPEDRTDLGEATKGLLNLFGGGPNKLQSFPAGLDKETYAQAKPHFEAALKAFQEAGKTIKDLFRWMIQNFGVGIKPYAVHFAKEINLTADLGAKPPAVRQVAEFVKGNPTSASNEVRPSREGSQTNWLAYIGWVLGGGFVLFIVIVIAASSGNNPKPHSASGNRSNVAPAPVSPYAQGIPAIDEGLARLIDSMLSAAQGNDPKSIEVAAAAIDKARNPKPGIEKAAAKESRVKNSLGLKASKAGNDPEAAKHFFEALKLNPYDQEIADNLGSSLYPIADYSAARMAYYVSLALNPRRSSAWMGLAKVFAVTGSNGKALNAFELGFRYTKSPKSARQALLAVYRDDVNMTVRTTAGSALATHYASAVADFIKPILGNLADVKIPLYLPTVVSVPQHEGKAPGLFAQNNSEFSARVKVVVASVMQPTVEYDQHPNASL